MAAPKTFHGARALVYQAGPTGTKLMGTFNTFSYGLNYDVAPVPILGRHSVAELVYTGSEPVRCSATGWRVPGNGPHVSGAMPHLGQLLTADYIELSVVDRQDPRVIIAHIKSVRPESYSTTIATKSLTEVTHTFVGILVDDESGDNIEAPLAADIS